MFHGRVFRCRLPWHRRRRERRRGRSPPLRARRDCLGSSPGGRCGPGIRADRRPAIARGRRSGTSGRLRGTGRRRTSRPAVRVGSGNPAPHRRRRCTAHLPPRLAGAAPMRRAHTVWCCRSACRSARAAAAGRDRSGSRRTRRPPLPRSDRRGLPAAVRPGRVRRTPGSSASPGVAAVVRRCRTPPEGSRPDRPRQARPRVDRGTV